MTQDERKALRKLAAASTKVTQWYPHGVEGTEPASVRAGYMRWLRCTEIDPQYRKYVADPIDDCKFAAAAMNALIPLLDKIDALEAEVKNAWDVYEANHG